MILQTKWCWYWPPSSGSIPKCFNPGTKIPHQMMMEGTQLTAKSFWSIFGQPGQTWLLFSEMYHTRWTNSAFVRRSLFMPTLWPAFAWTTTMLRSCFTISIVSMEWFNCDRSSNVCNHVLIYTLDTNVFVVQPYFLKSFHLWSTHLLKMCVCKWGWEWGRWQLGV